MKARMFPPKWLAHWRILPTFDSVSAPVDIQTEKLRNGIIVYFFYQAPRLSRHFKSSRAGKSKQNSRAWS
jgi:hypothetical protein